MDRQILIEQIIKQMWQMFTYMNSGQKFYEYSLNYFHSCIFFPESLKLFPNKKFNFLKDPFTDQNETMENV